ncbi:MAG: RsmB/NOP family class I SAM-dependent RNA methyltransferase [Victivallales bacterium]|nr:RsmB/NOP family class I SAM-dependent RNA methyltransferase [Victivallales bacterium]
MNYDRIASQGFHCAETIATVLAQTLIRRRPADRSLSSAFYEHHEFGSRDRRLISETLFSVLRWWGWLKHLAPKQFLEAVNHPADQIELSFPLSAFYPLFAMSWYMEGKNELPDGAKWWCEEAGIEREDIKFLPQDASPLERRRYLKPFLPDETPALKPEDLLPDWCYRRIRAPRPVEELLEWLQHRPPVWLRLNTQDPDAIYKELRENDFRASFHRVMKEAVCLEFAGGNLRALQCFKNGSIEIQDIASQCVAMICDPKPGEQWWDACAGGGGKTLHLATLMQQKGVIVASDIRAHKLQDLKLRARRGQFPNIRCKEWKGKDLPTYKNHFHGVLVDTPCSCSGTWRRNPDGRWTTFDSDIAEFTALQSQLLENASHAVRPGGTLVYSTCSMFFQENQEIIDAFLSKHDDFSLVPFKCPLTKRKTNGINQLWPWDADCDAMFTAKMQRNP